MKHALVTPVLAALLAAALGRPLAGQEALDPAMALDDDVVVAELADIEHLAAAEFGSAYQNTVIGAPDFRPLTSDTTWAYDGAGYLYRTGGGNTTFWAPVHLPPGAEIDLLCFLGYDSAPTSLTYDFAAYEMARANGSPGFSAPGPGTWTLEVADEIDAGAGRASYFWQLEVE